MVIAKVTAFILRLVYSGVTERTIGKRIFISLSLSLHFGQLLNILFICLFACFLFLWLPGVITDTCKCKCKLKDFLLLVCFKMYSCYVLVISVLE